MVLRLEKCFLFPKFPMLLLWLLPLRLLQLQLLLLLLSTLVLLLLNKLGLINSFANQLLVKFKSLSESISLSNSRCTLSTSRWRCRLQSKACRLKCTTSMLSCMVRFTLRGTDKVLPVRVLAVLLLQFSLKVPLVS